LHVGCPFHAALGIASVNDDALDRPNRANGSKLRARLITGADHANRLRVGARKSTRCNAGGRARAKLAEPIRLDDGKPLAGRCIEMHPEARAALRAGVGFVAEPVIDGRGQHMHDRAILAVANTCARRILRPSRSKLATRAIDGRERIAHSDDACDLRFGDVANHLFHVVRSDRSEIVIAVTGGNRAVEYGCDRR